MAIVLISNDQLKAFLEDSELIPKKDLEAALDLAVKNKEPLKKILLKQDKISEENLSRLEAYILGIPFISLINEKIDSEILFIIPESIARTHSIVPYKKTGDNLEVAMLDPEDLKAIEFIKKKSNLKILPRLTDSFSIKHILTQYQKSLEAEFGEIIKKESKSHADEKTKEIKFLENKEKKSSSYNENELAKMAEDMPVIKIVDTLLRHAIIQKASDIHIEAMEKEVLVRYRIDGILRDAMTLPKVIAFSIIARIKVLSNLKLDEHRLPQDGRFKIETESEKVSFRVSILPVFDGEKAVLRLLPENIKGISLETLGFTENDLDILHRAIKKPVGMILATGPTGSGKTTTLYSILEILNTPAVNISTIEDPIEYRVARVNQSQVKPEIGFSFASGLRSLLRQDPDIIMVGEIRDNETASLAINASLTGHLVLSTLHTNSAAGALPRLLDMKIEPFLITSTINIIIAQRLVRTLCKNKEPYILTQDELEELGKNINLDEMLKILKKEKLVGPKDDWKNIEFYKPVPSKDFEDGYSGRVGIHEMLQMSETIKHLVMSNSTADDIENQAKKDGMKTMFQDGIIKAVQGLTTIEEILRVTRE